MKNFRHCTVSVSSVKHLNCLRLTHLNNFVQLILFYPLVKAFVILYATSVLYSVTEWLVTSTRFLKNKCFVSSMVFDTLSCN